MKKSRNSKRNNTKYVINQRNISHTKKLPVAWASLLYWPVNDIDSECVILEKVITVQSRSIYNAELLERISRVRAGYCAYKLYNCKITINTKSKHHSESKLISHYCATILSKIISTPFSLEHAFEMWRIILISMPNFQFPNLFSL